MQVIYCPAEIIYSAELRTSLVWPKWRRGQWKSQSAKLFVIELLIDTSRPVQNGRQFIDDIFTKKNLKRKVLNVDAFSLSIIPDDAISDNSVLNQVMGWDQISDKLLSELIFIQFTEVYMRHQASKYLNQNLSTMKFMSTKKSINKHIAWKRFQLFWWNMNILFITYAIYMWYDICVSSLYGQDTGLK